MTLLSAMSSLLLSASHLKLDKGASVLNVDVKHGHIPAPACGAVMTEKLAFFAG